MVRRLLQRGDLSETQRFKGQQVELFWPEDATWWLARIIKVSPCASNTRSRLCVANTSATRTRMCMLECILLSDVHAGK